MGSRIRNTSAIRQNSNKGNSRNKPKDRTNANSWTEKILQYYKYKRRGTSTLFRIPHGSYWNAMYPEDQGKRDYDALRAHTELDAEHLHIVFEAYYRMGLGKQVEEVIDSLWKLGLPFVPSEPLVDELEEVERSGDWRKIVKEWKYIKEKSPPKFKVQF